MAYMCTKNISEGSIAKAGSIFEGWDIGAVSIKRVWIGQDGVVHSDIRRHCGQPEKISRKLLKSTTHVPAGVVVTGPQANSIFNLPYFPEAICIEAAMKHLQCRPDLVLSLGGESFVIYCMADGIVHNMVVGNRCAAGSGEFLIQQFCRMDLDLETGIKAAINGKHVKMASRCSVHCKSDATHKLNKGECTPADIAISLIADLAVKIADLVESTNWRHHHIVLSGGLTKNQPLIDHLTGLLKESQVEMKPESAFLEAFGAAIYARQNNLVNGLPPDSWIKTKPAHRFAQRKPLDRFAHRVKQIDHNGLKELKAGMELILGVDAGSTTTKAILLDRISNEPVASCYLRTHGNPVQSTINCLKTLDQQITAKIGQSQFQPTIVQTAVTGSGRDLVSVYLDNCLSFNEILAHARAAREVASEVDTLFELGGQDAKFVSLQSGIPVDYTMNDGCSAGTGSFLEEAAASDMNIPIEQIGPLALSGNNPIIFGERCAAFINSDVRAALSQGMPYTDVLAGLVYAITDNYLSRVVGARHIGQQVLLQGGVALNPALAPAFAALTGMNVMVPPHPELMGCIGAAQMANDLLMEGTVDPIDRKLQSFNKVLMQTRNTFTCKECDNRCEIKKIALNDDIYPFGGLCAKWVMQRRPKSMRCKPGKDLLAVRNQLMFKAFAPEKPVTPRGRIGLPLALSTYALYPFFATLLTELGYEVVLSRPGHGNRRTYAPTCYPAEIAVAAVDDLLTQDVDYIFLPYLREFSIPEGHSHAYLCPVTNDIPGVIKSTFKIDTAKILTPEMGFSDHLISTTQTEIVRLCARLGINKTKAINGFRTALSRQQEFDTAYQKKISQELEQLSGPAVVLVGRPYAAFAPEVNLSVARKIISRGYTVIPGDGLRFAPPADERDVWHMTQRIFSAIEYTRQNPDAYICVLSCFSCGPDAITHHRLRDELEGKPFCFLEIDSHTAHAGIETRIGAFLDIIEQRRRHKHTPKNTETVLKCYSRIVRKKNKPHVEYAQNRYLPLNDKRVTHVLLADLPQITSRICAQFFNSLGWNVVITPDTDLKILQTSRKVCSGRECLPFLSMMGKVVTYLENRASDEFTLFHLLELEGPCEIGNWFEAFNRIVLRLGADNAAAVWPTINNNYLGCGERLAVMLMASAIAGDLMAEVRNSLRCLAVDTKSALTILDGLEANLIASAQRGSIALERELRRTAARLSQIPLKNNPRDLPKILLFGGINRLFVDKPVQSFFENQGILAKTNNVTEFLSSLEFESVERSGFAHGCVRPEQQYALSTITSNIVKGPSRFSALKALRARAHCSAIEAIEQRWHRIMQGSGLLFSQLIPFRKVANISQDMVSWNSMTEAPCTIGRYFASLDANAFDGYVNIGSFNCAPANSATAVINALGRNGKAPYAAIEADGTAITPNQLRQLETLAAQCMRRKAAEK